MKRIVAIRNDIVCWSFQIFLLFSLVGCGQASTPIWYPPVNTHDVVYGDSLKLLWFLPNIFIEASPGKTDLIASNKRVYIYGSMDINERSGINALDAFTGDLLWKSGSMRLDALTVDSEGLYIGESGGGGSILKISPDNGEVLWSRSFWFTSGVEHLIVYEEILHAFLVPDKHRVFRTLDGNSIVSMLINAPPYFDSVVCGEVYQTPVYTSDTVYYRTGEGLALGEVCAVDIYTGKLRWTSKMKVVSNVAVTNNAIFTITENGDIVTLNPSTGEVMSILGFVNNEPLVLYEPRVEVGNYFVAYDEEDNILLVYLGDSRQLFAFLTDEK